jgi:hypothetical protein
MKLILLLIFLSSFSYSQVSFRNRGENQPSSSPHVGKPKPQRHSKEAARAEVKELNRSSDKLDEFIEKYRDKPAIWDFTLMYDFKTATTLRGRLLNSIVSTNLESPLVVEIYPDQGLPEGSILSCLGMTKFKRVISGCSRLITPGSTGEEYAVEISLLNTDGTAGITGEYYSGKELYVAGMIASSFARGSIELSQSRIATASGEMKINSAKNRYLEGILNSADEGADLMKKEMQTTEPKVFVKAGKEVLVFFNQRFKI